MDGAHETFDDGELVKSISNVRMSEDRHAYIVMHDFGKGCKTIGGAGGVGHDLVFGLVSVEVHTADEPVYL